MKMQPPEHLRDTHLGAWDSDDIIFSQDEAHWLQARQEGITASVVSALLNRSPYTTARALWRQKKGLEGGDVKVTDLMEWGNRFQHAIAVAWCEKVAGDKLLQCIDMQHTLMRRPGHPRSMATLDYLVQMKSGTWVEWQVLEIKKVMYKWRKEWGEAGSDQVPVHISDQVQLQMACSDTQVGHIGVVIGDCDFRHYVIQRDDKLVARLQEAIDKFWNHHMATDTPPLPQWDHPTTLALMGKEEHRPTATMMGDNEQQLAEAYVNISDSISKLQRQRDAIQARLVFAMDGGTAGQLPDGRQVKRKQVERSGYVVQPTTYWQFEVE